MPAFFDPERKCSVHRSYRPIGYVHELQQNAIYDPIAFDSKEVLGYFPLKNPNEALGCKKYIDLMQTVTDSRFNVFGMMSAHVYARTVYPCSKSKTFDEVIPKLFEGHAFSLDQLYSGLTYIGLE